MNQQLARTQTTSRQFESAGPILTHLGPAIQRITAMSRLPAGWDGSDGVPISATAVAIAFELMVSAAARSGSATTVVVPWTSAPFADGGLQIEWKGTGGELEVQISPDGTLGYLLQIGTDDVAVDESDQATTEQVLDLIQRVVDAHEPR